MHHHVDHPVFEQIFSPLEAFRQTLFNCVLDDAWASETDKGIWLGNVNIAQHAIRSGHAASRWIGEQHNIGQATFA